MLRLHVLKKKEKYRNKKEKILCVLCVIHVHFPSMSDILNFCVCVSYKINLQSPFFNRPLNDSGLKTYKVCTKAFVSLPPERFLYSVEIIFF